MEQIKITSLSKAAKEAINDFIRTMNLDKDNKLPSEDNLAQILGVSRVTIRTALNELSTEGIIFRRQGKGTFVNLEALRMKATLTPVCEISKIIEDFNCKVSIKIISLEIFDSDYGLQNNLNINKDEKIIEIKKVFYGNDKPWVYCVDYIPLKFFDKNEYKKLKKYNDSLYKFLQDNMKIKILWDKSQIYTKTNINNEELNEIFNLENNIKSFLVVKSINYDCNDKPIFISYEYTDTDLLSFSLIRQKNS